MLELGENAPASHFRIGYLMASLKVSRLFAFGKEAAEAALGAREGGMDPAAIEHTADRGKLRGAVRGFLAEGDVVLVKGSRGMRLDEIAGDIREAWA
jgi:UDP-N-acetylmuramoyl-tripeptide--D-alanyl-D-alanine ligase